MKYLNQLVTEWIGECRSREVRFYRLTDSAFGCLLSDAGGPDSGEGFGEEPRTAFAAAVESFECRAEFDPGPVCDAECIKNRECRGHTLQVID